MTGVPSIVAIQPGSRSAPTRSARYILFPAIAVVAASKRRCGSVRAGAAMDMGLVPSLGSAAKVGSTNTLVPAPPEGGGHADHVLLCGQHRMMTHGAHVAAVLHDCDADTHVACLGDRPPHRPWGDDHAETAITIED